MARTKKLDLSSPNLTPQIDNDDLEMIGKEQVRKFEGDKDSMQPWLERRAKVRKLFACVRETRSFPWHGASKACVPIVTVAIQQFQARSREELLPAKGTVNIRHTGWEDASRAKRVETFMNDQVRRTRRYKQEIDNMLVQVALDGTAFRKAWYDEIEGVIKYKTIAASDVVVSYSYTGDIRDCRRITHVLWLTPDELEDRYRAKIFNDHAHDLKGGTVIYEDGSGEDPIRTAARYIEGVTVGDDVEDADENDSDKGNRDQPRMVLEQHTWLDLTGDGRSQPYVVTIDFESKKVLRIVSREYVENGTPRVQHFFTKYDFFPNPDGFYGFGLGSLLENYNALANALVNMLIDSGTLQNTTAGFISERCGIDRGDLMFKPGELKVYEGLVQDINKDFKLIDFKPPSNVLMMLLGQIQQWGKEIASVSDIMQGLEQAANQTATTTITLVEQGLKLFSAVHQRIRTAFKEELELAYLLNRMHLTDEVFNSTLGNDGSEEFQAWMMAQQQHQELLMQALPLIMMGQPVQLPPPPPEFPFSVEADFAAGYDVQPEADPQIVGQAQRLVVAKETYMTTIQNPLTQADPEVNREALRRYYEAMGQQDIEPLLPKLPPPPPPPQDLDQHIENAMFISGDVMTPKVLPHQSHAEHLDAMGDLFDGPEWEHMDPARRAAAEQHRSEHEAYFYLEKQGMLNEGPAMAVPLPEGAAPGGGFPGLPPAGGFPQVVAPPGDTDLSTTVGPGEAFDNAPASLRGRFDLATAAGVS